MQSLHVFHSLLFADEFADEFANEFAGEFVTKFFHVVIYEHFCVCKYGGLRACLFLSLFTCLLIFILLSRHNMLTLFCNKNFSCFQNVSKQVD